VIYLPCPVPANPLRSFDDIFPGIEDNQKMRVFSAEGFYRPFGRNEQRSVIPNPGLGINLYSAVAEKNPSHFIEALLVVPCNGTPLGIRDAYNAVGRIENIKNHSYFNRSLNTNFFIFEESSRIESAKKTRPIPDPPPSSTFPASEEIYLYLKDRNFGNIYVRGDLSADPYGLTFVFTNFKAIRFLVFPIMGAGKFCAALYLEPLEEGLLIYGMGAVDIPDFIASRIDIPSSVERRMSIFISWLKEGLKRAPFFW
jgi:hypothetical protein